MEKRSAVFTLSANVIVSHDPTQETSHIGQTIEQFLHSMSDEQFDLFNEAVKIEAAERNKRQGYRHEIRQWMKRNGIENIPSASKRLAISDTALKSIMSDKGTPRYGQELLERVLTTVRSS